MAIEIHAVLMVASYICVGLLFKGMMYIHSNDDNTETRRTKQLVGKYFLAGSFIIYITCICMLGSDNILSSYLLSWLYWILAMFYYYVCRYYYDYIEVIE